MLHVHHEGEEHDHAHAEAFAGMSTGFRRALIAAILINGALFVVEMMFGFLARSQALKADSLDFLADCVTYALSFWAIGKPLAWRSRTALLKGGSLVVMALFVLATTAYNVLVLHVPVAETMGGIAILALAANVVSVLILMRWREGDANVRSVWLCSRNDAIGNVAVIVAAILVSVTGTGWPDIAVATLMAGLFLYSAVRIFSQAAAELRTGRVGHGHSHGNEHDHGHEPASHNQAAHAHSHEGARALR